MGVLLLRAYIRAIESVASLEEEIAQSQVVIAEKHKNHQGTSFLGGRVDKFFSGRKRASVISLSFRLSFVLSSNSDVSRK